MGTSTNAILAFGFDLGEVCTQDLEAVFSTKINRTGSEDEEFDFDVWVVDRAGLVPPDERLNGDSSEYEAYIAACQAAIEACPVELITHCSGEAPNYFLALRGTSTVARRGYPEVVQTKRPKKKQIDAMRAFCKKYNIDWQVPQWFLFSMWH